MNITHWFLLILSAVLYAISFIYSYIWGLVFIFPIPLLYLVCIYNLSFIHGFVWGLIFFALHLHDGIFIITRLAGNFWWVGCLIGICMVLYQALWSGLLFYSATTIIIWFSIDDCPLLRLFAWVLTLFCFIYWVDQYCLWIFGILEGYPFMHPLILLTQQPGLLLLLPILGKSLLTILFLCISASFVSLLWYKNNKAFCFFVSICSFWIWSWLTGFKQAKQPDRYNCIKSLPCMVYSTGKNPQVTMKVVARHIKNTIEQHPQTTTIIMPESALNIMDLEDKPELLLLWHEKYTAKPLHIILGTCRAKDGNYYNSLYWVYNGELKAHYDKKHAMMITERLANWMDYDFMRTIYFKDGISITKSCNERLLLKMSEDISFVPYICSEFFFTEYPDDCYENVPIIVMVNDTLLDGSYMQTLLLLLAQFKAIQWQREIVYVSYAQSVVIDKVGETVQMNG